MEERKRKKVVFRPKPKIPRELATMVLSFVIDEIAELSISWNFDAIFDILSSCHPNDLRKYQDKILKNLCIRGNIGALIRCTSMLKFVPNKDVKNVTTLYAAACEHGRLRTAKWLVNRFGLSGNIPQTLGWRTFKQVCENGHTPTARWLMSEHKFTSEDLSRPSKKHVIESSCENGHTLTVKWLVSEFKLESSGHSAVFRNAFENACANGRLETAKWLRLTFGDHILVDKRGTFYLTCSNGHLDTAIWLTTEFNIDKKALDGRELAAFRVACQRHDLEMARWLALKFNLGGNHHELALGFDLEEYSAEYVAVQIAHASKAPEGMKRAPVVAQDAVRIARADRFNKIISLAKSSR